MENSIDMTVVAYLHIFEKKLQDLIKHIKKAKKTHTKDDIKTLVREAKNLRDKVIAMQKIVEPESFDKIKTKKEINNKINEILQDQKYEELDVSKKSWIAALCWVLRKYE